MINHEGEGSLSSVLKEKSFINYISAEVDDFSNGIHFFNIHIGLTENGLFYTDDIITMVFQYINMMKKEGAIKRIFDVRFSCLKIFI